jgi:uncharacterized membrane protein
VQLATQKWSVSEDKVYIKIPINCTVWWIFINLFDSKEHRLTLLRDATSYSELNVSEDKVYIKIPINSTVWWIFINLFDSKEHRLTLLRSATSYSEMECFRG